jgi:hypothetical protein
MVRPVRRTGVGLAALAATLLAVAAAAPPATTSSAPLIQAELDGRPIPAVDVGRFACHDLDFPIIRCFGSPAMLDSAQAARSLVLPGDLSSPAALTSYVKVFPDRDLRGNPAVLSQAYDDLSIIGWNDRISSFQGLGGAGGTFFEHIYRGGAAYSFSAYQTVTYVGDRYNDTFSSVVPR